MRTEPDQPERDKSPSLSKIRRSHSFYDISSCPDASSGFSPAKSHESLPSNTDWPLKRTKTRKPSDKPRIFKRSKTKAPQKPEPKDDQALEPSIPSRDGDILTKKPTRRASERWFKVRKSLILGKRLQKVADACADDKDRRIMRGSTMDSVQLELAKRLKRTPRGIISPQAYWKRTWDLVIALLSVFESIFAAYILSVGIDIVKHPPLIGVVAFVDAFFVADIIITFFTAYFEVNTLIIKRRAIVRRYLRSNFALDFLSIVPFYCISSGWLLIKVPKIASWRVLRMKLSKFFLWLKDTKPVASSWRYRIDLVSIILCRLLDMYIFTHMTACLGSYLTLKGGKTMFESEALEHVSGYINHIYYVICTMTGVGYGDVGGQFQDSGDYLTMSWLLLFSIIAFAFLVQRLRLDFEKMAHRPPDETKELHKLRQWIMKVEKDRWYRVSEELKRTISMHYLEYLMDLIVKNSAFVASLPYNLKKRILFSVFSQFSSEFSAFLSLFSDDMKVELFLSLQYRNFLSNTMIFMSGDESDGIYFIRKGQIFITPKTDHTVISKAFGEGTIFGEEFLMKKPIEFNIRTGFEFTSGFFIPRVVFRKLIHKANINKRRIYRFIYCSREGEYLSTGKSPDQSPTLIRKRTFSAEIKDDIFEPGTAGRKRNPSFQDHLAGLGLLTRRMTIVTATAIQEEDENDDEHHQKQEIFRSIGQEKTIGPIEADNSILGASADRMLTATQGHTFQDSETQIVTNTIGLDALQITDLDISVPRTYTVSTGKKLLPPIRIHNLLTQRENFQMKLQFERTQSIKAHSAVSSCSSDSDSSESSDENSSEASKESENKEEEEKEKEIATSIIEVSHIADDKAVGNSINSITINTITEKTERSPKPHHHRRRDHKPSQKNMNRRGAIISEQVFHRRIPNHLNLNEVRRTREMSVSRMRKSVHRETVFGALKGALGPDVNFGDSTILSLTELNFEEESSSEEDSSDDEHENLDRSIDFPVDEQQERDVVMEEGNEEEKIIEFVNSLELKAHLLKCRLENMKRETNTVMNQLYFKVKLTKASLDEISKPS